MGELGSMSSGFPNQPREICQGTGFGQELQQNHPQAYQTYPNPQYPMTGGLSYHPSPPDMSTSPPGLPEWKYAYDDPQQMFLQISEEPITKIRFRYQSERGSHGSMAGRNSSNTQKSWPTVRLINYTGGDSSGIKVHASLYTEDKQKPHVHKLLGKSCNVEVGDCILPLQADLSCSFPSLGVLFTEKKRVQKVLLNRKLDQFNGAHSEDLRSQFEEEAKQEAKDMKLNAIRIRFQAYNANNEAITQPVFSEPVHNLKSPDSGELKITRLSRFNSRIEGGDEVFLLCEKVNKKDIKVKFFQHNEAGEEIWKDFGTFTDSDVHHQVAIVFRTPPYVDHTIDKPVNVFVQLYRQNDGETSESLPFTYKPRDKDPDKIHNKRRRLNDPDFGGHHDFPGHQQNQFGPPAPGHGHWPDGSGNPGQSEYTLMPPHGHTYPVNQMANFVEQFVEELRMSSSPGSSQDSIVSVPSEMGSTSQTSSTSPALTELHQLARPFGADTTQDVLDPTIAPSSYIGQDAGTPFPDFGSVEMDATVLSSKKNTSEQEEMDDVNKKMNNCSVREMYIGESDSETGAQPPINPFFLTTRNFKDKDPMQIKRPVEMGRHAAGKQRSSRMEMRRKSEPGKLDTHPKQETTPSERLPKLESVKGSSSSKMPSEPKSRTAIESFVRKQIIPRFGRSLRLFTSTGKVHSLLWTLAPFLASPNDDGDNALHLAVIHQSENNTMFEQLMPVVRSLMPYDIINHTNNMYQTPLHLAVAIQEVNVISWLLLSGADPTLQDFRGNTPIHLAVLKKDHASLAILLEKSLYRTHTPQQPLPNSNLLNFEGYSALHLAVLLGSQSCLSLLMDSGADVNIQDGTSGRTPLHLAVEMQSALVEDLLKQPLIHVDAVDYAGNTALHLACSLELYDLVHTLMVGDANPLAENYTRNRDGEDEEEEDGDDDDVTENKDVLEEKESKENRIRGRTPIDMATGNTRLQAILKGTLTPEEISQLRQARRQSRDEMKGLTSQAPDTSCRPTSPAPGRRGSRELHEPKTVDSFKKVIAEDSCTDSGLGTSEQILDTKEEINLEDLCELLDPPNTGWKMLASVVYEEYSMVDSIRKLEKSPTRRLCQKIKDRGEILKTALDAAGLLDVCQHLFHEKALDG